MRRDGCGCGKPSAQIKAGDRVNIEPGVPCGHCRYFWKANITSARTLILWRHNLTPRRINALSVSSGELYLQTARNMDTMEGALVEPAAVGMHAGCWQMLNRVRR